METFCQPRRSRGVKSSVAEGVSRVAGTDWAATIERTDRLANPRRPVAIVTDDLSSSCASSSSAHRSLRDSLEICSIPAESFLPATDICLR